jgi:methyl-accepting chemotaxis protein
MEANETINEEVMTLAENIVDVVRSNTEREEVINLVAHSLQPLHDHIEDLKKRIAAGKATLEDLKNGMAELSTQLDTFRERGFV